MKAFVGPLLSSVCAFSLLGCPRAGGEDAGLADAGERDGGEGDAGQSDGGQSDGGQSHIDNPWGFPMRRPASRTVACEEDPFSCPDGTFVASDIDYVCTLSLDGHDAVVYLQATPTGVFVGGFPFPTYDDVRAFLAEGDQLVEVDASYDYGGNHHNDFFTLVIGGVRYTWDHSSYGFGFRACQPPDCVKREEGANYTDGCSPERTLPEACIAVSDPLPALVDNFSPCEGDNG